jgi:hypothetical protein
MLSWEPNKTQNISCAQNGQLLNIEPSDTYVYCVSIDSTRSFSQVNCNWFGKSNSVHPEERTNYEYNMSVQKAKMTQQSLY